MYKYIKSAYSDEATLPKSELSKLKRLLKKWFYGNNNSYSASPWRISNGGYDLVCEIYLNGSPVCGVFNDTYGYKVEGYVEYSYEIEQAVKDAFKEMNVDVVE